MIHYTRDYLCIITIKMNMATDAGNNILEKTTTSTTFRSCYHENLFCKSFTN